MYYRVRSKKVRSNYGNKYAKAKAWKKKSRRVLKILLLLTTLVLFVVLGGATYLYVKAMGAEKEFHETLDRGEKSELRTEAVDVGKHNFSVLLLEMMLVQVKTMHERMRC